MPTIFHILNLNNLSHQAESAIQGSSLSYAVIPRHYFMSKNHYDVDVSSVRVSIHSREKRASALDLTAEGDIDKGHFTTPILRSFRVPRLLRRIEKRLITKKWSGRSIVVYICQWTLFEHFCNSPLNYVSPPSRQFH